MKLHSYVTLKRGKNLRFSKNWPQNLAKFLQQMTVSVRTTVYAPKTYFTLHEVGTSGNIIPSPI